MTTQDTPVEETTTTEEEPTSRFDKIKPIAKKALIWTGAAVGLIAGAVLVAGLRSNREDEIDVYVLEETPSVDVPETESPVD